MKIDMGGYRLRFGEEIVLERAPVSEKRWGYFQFPSLLRYTDGSIVASWAHGPDDIRYRVDESPNGACHTVSKDGGATWVHGGEYTGCSTKNLMKNGRYFRGFEGGGAYETDYLEKYTPAYVHRKRRLFFADDVKEERDKTVTASEYDPVTGRTEVFDVKVNWPYMPLVEFTGGRVYPTTQIFCLNNRPTITHEGELYIALYFYGFDSFALSREEAVKEYCDKYSVFVFKSCDSGRTFDLISQIMTDESITGATEGLCEPDITVMPDGSFVMLMRTGQRSPCYITRSTDKGVSWSEPRKFDDFGVLPQLLTLGCGVTLASYGRPLMRFNATDDPSGIEWGRAFEIPVTGGEGQSCYYTDLLPLDDDTALFIYSDFCYPDQNGEGAKTILARTVTVERD